MTERDDSPFRRILLALEPGSAAPETIEAAAELAERLRVELSTLFVEDENLLRLGGLPFVRQMSLTTGRWSALDADAMVGEMRDAALRIERALSAAASRRNVAHSFRVVRGHLARVIEDAAATADLLIVEGASRPLTRHMGLAAAGRSLARQALGSVLLIHAGLGGARNPIAIYDGGVPSARTLSVARALARRGGGRLTVAIPDGPDVDSLEAKARAALGPDGQGATYTRIPGNTPETLCAVSRTTPESLLVLASDNPALTERTADTLMDRISCPLLIVR
jgi:nucleotide-binding universal stress UspA family protein